MYRLEGRGGSDRLEGGDHASHIPPALERIFRVR